jgi:MFS family permease
MKAGSLADTSPRIGWPGALLLVLAGVVSAFHVGKASAVLQALRADLGLGLATASWLLSASGVAGALLGVPAGLLADRAGARRTTVAGLLVQAGASAIGALAAHPGWLLASRIAEGVGFQLVAVAAPALIATAMPARDRAAAMAAWSTFMPVGLAAALLAVHWLPAGGWEGLWWAGTFAALAAAVALRMALPESARGTGPTRLAQDLATVWRARGPAGLALLFGLFSASYFAVFGFLPMLLEGAARATGAPTHVLAATAVAASAAGNLAGLALLARGIRPTTVIVASFAALAACSVPIAMEAAADPLARYGASVVFGAVAGLIPAALFAEAPARAPHARLQGLVIGMMMQGNNIGLVAGPPLAGAAASLFGWGAVAAIVTALALVAATAVRALAATPIPRPT